MYEFMFFVTRAVAISCIIVIVLIALSNRKSNSGGFF